MSKHIDSGLSNEHVSMVSTFSIDEKIPRRRFQNKSCAALPLLWYVMITLVCLWHNFSTVFMRGLTRSSNHTQSAISITCGNTLVCEHNTLLSGGSNQSISTHSIFLQKCLLIIASFKLTLLLIRGSVYSKSDRMTSFASNKAAAIPTKPGPDPSSKTVFSFT